MQSIIQYLLPLKREIANASRSLNDNNGFSKGIVSLDDKFVAVTNRETNDKIVIVSEGCEDHGELDTKMQDDNIN